MARRETGAAAPSNSRLVRRRAGEERRTRRLAETAGETAAECAAICCCCPCCVAKFVVVVAVKLPAGLARRTLQRSKAAPSSRKKAAIAPKELIPAGDHPEEACPARSPAEAMSELEKVMRANFYGAGFWRSLSQREWSSPEC